VGARRLLQPQGLFGGALVDLLQDEFGALTVEGVVGLGQGAFGTGVRDLIEEYDDIRRCLSSAFGDQRNAAWPVIA